MGNYILRRFLVIVPLLIVISVISFIVVQLPPGSYVETYIQNLKNQGYQPDENEIERLESRYGLNQPAYIQYFTWMKNMIFEGDMGRSFVYKQPVSEIIAERAPMTIMISLMAILLQWIVAVPIGIFSARYQYSIFDYIVTFFGFIGLALPNFLFALVLMYFVYVHTGWAVVGIFSPEFVDASWSFARVLDMLKNLWIPLVVIATAGTAGLIRTLRGTLLDELKKQYVTTARAKGMKERKLILKYPVRVAINPLISTIGWMLPAIVGGEVVVSQVLNLKTLGPVLLGSVQSEDMYLAGGIIMILSSLTVIGTLLSDILLAWVDPKVRYK
ncbi:ABC transporter permease [Halanaerobium kushneri]|uniref:Peptide/nickel transport system permease protein n=1 Tax=Halanaerobium kushneri TaxID=56779 RepID=A0A1N6TFJ7_9FIRM|nr:ABC transporter permease [Halanaerobium kushneri]SIQ51886.1 peptide/nickel transport system permease protein [Halanaerobium kushneri]